MASSAYSNFATRIRTATSVAKTAHKPWPTDTVLGLSSAAAVLITAALERYLIDVTEETAGGVFPADPKKLTPAQRRVLYVSMASRIRGVSERIVEEEGNDPKRLGKFGVALLECWGGLANPSSWSYRPRMGLFDESTKTIEKLEAVLKRLDPDGRSVFDYLDANGLSAVTSRTLLAALVQKRHEVAHALEGGTPVALADVMKWATFIIRFVRNIERFLG